MFSAVLTLLIAGVPPLPVPPPAPPAVEITEPAPVAPAPRAAAPKPDADHYDPRNCVCVLDLGSHGGSGTVIWSEDGYSLVLTNHHITDCGRDTGGRCRVTMPDGRVFEGQCMSFDRESDLGLVWVRGELPVARVSRTDVSPGTRLRHWGRTSRYTEGRALGSAGFVNHDSRHTWKGTYSSVPGDSGAGLFNDDGELCGVNWGYEPGSGSALFVPVARIRVYVVDAAGPRFGRLRDGFGAFKPRHPKPYAGPKPPDAPAKPPTVPKTDPKPPAGKSPFGSAPWPCPPGGRA